MLKQVGQVMDACVGTSLGVKDVTTDFCTICNSLEATFLKGIDQQVTQTCGKQVKVKRAQ